MSRFFAASSSSEDEEEFVQVQKGNRFGTFYDSEEDETGSEAFSDEETEEEEATGVEGSQGEEDDLEATKRNRFLFGSDSEDEDEDEGQRQVKSAKEKAEEEFEAVCDSLEANLDGKDWASLQADHDKLVKLMSKNTKFITRAVFDTLKLVDEVTGEVSAEEKKKMTGGDAKAFNAVRQKTKKVLSQYADMISAPTSIAGMDTKSSRRLSEEASVPKVIEMTPENVLRKLQEVISSRGRKHSDKQENIATLKKLYEIALNDRHRAQVLVGTIAAEFDLIIGSVGYLSLETWTEAVKDTDRLLEILVKNEPSSLLDKEAEDMGLPGLSGIQGSLLSFVHRLDDEFTKALQIIDPNTTEYEDFLRAEKQLYSVLGKTSNYFSFNAEYQCQILLRQLEHLYFRPECVIVLLQANSRTVAEMCHKLYQLAPEKIKIRALLCHVYHLALHGQYARARDLFVASNVSDNLGSLEISTQILYNRTVVQLGLAAFQRGLLKETYFALQEICSSGRPRELLAQGLQSQKYADRTPEQERAERQRQLPHHMHLSIELVDSVFLTSSMLLEIPQAAASARRFFRGDKKLFPSRHLRRLIDGYDRNLFNGPPENTRDHIISAAKSLANGQWQKCLELTLQSKLWTLFPNPTEINEMLQRKVKEAAICTYILAFGPTFSSLSLEVLSSTFSLNPPLVRKIMEKLIQDHGLPAQLEDSFVVWSQDVDISPVQELILQIKDKLSVLAERNYECTDIITRKDMTA